MSSALKERLLEEEAGVGSSVGAEMQGCEVTDEQCPELGVPLKAPGLGEQHKLSTAACHCSPESATFIAEQSKQNCPLKRKVL